MEIIATEVLEELSKGNVLEKEISLYCSGKISSSGNEDASEMRNLFQEVSSSWKGKMACLWCVSIEKNLKMCVKSFYMESHNIISLMETTDFLNGKESKEKISTHLSLFKERVRGVLHAIESYEKKLVLWSNEYLEHLEDMSTWEEEGEVFMARTLKTIALIGDLLELLTRKRARWEGFFQVYNEVCQKYEREDLSEGVAELKYWIEGVSHEWAELEAA